LIRGIGQDGKADVVLGKALCVLSKAELRQPVSDLPHRGSAHDYRALFARAGIYPRRAQHSRQQIPREQPRIAIDGARGN